MCPACLSTWALLAAGGTSTGGLAAVVAAARGRKWRREPPPDPEGGLHDVHTNDRRRPLGWADVPDMTTERREER